MSKTDSRRSTHNIPYILQFERLALNILKDRTDSKERLRELLEKYAAKYTEQSAS